jgi:hypothetical protein
MEVDPSDTFETIRHKVSFFSVFTQRHYSLQIVETGETLPIEKFSKLSFRDAGLKTGSRLVMRPPQKERIYAEDPSNEQEVLEEGFGGGGEGGEDEMLEMEGGEDQMDEE